MRIITDIKDLPLSLDGNEIAYDLETTGLDPKTDKILIIAVSNGIEDYAVDCTKVSSLRALRWVRHISKGKCIVGHNLAFDLKFAMHQSVFFDATYHDTMLCEQLLTAGLLVPLGFNLRAVAGRYLNLELEKETRNEFIGGFNLTLERRHFEYAVKDVRYLFEIKRQQLAKVKRHGLEKVCALEMECIPSVALMEYSGVALDKESLESLVPIFDRIVTGAEKTLQDLFISNGCAESILFDGDKYTAVNLNSKPGKRTDSKTGVTTYRLGQVYEAFQTLGIEPVDKKGNPTLSAKHILRWDMKHADKEYDYAEYLNIDPVEDEDLAAAITAFEGLKHPVLRAYAFYIASTKLRDSYVLGTLKKYDEKTKRVYGWFKQLGARATGRFSSDMQQIPNDTKLKRLSIPYSIRGCFIAPENKTLLIADYSGIELVILADYSNDEVLGQLIVDSAAGKDDMHLYVVRHAFTDLFPEAIHATLENKNKSPFPILRQAAKPTSYGIAYGITGMALADTITKELASLNIKCDASQAQTILDNWKQKAFVKAGKWLDTASLAAIRNGHSVTRLGRKRWFDLEYAADKEWKRHAIMREGSNAPIQGACADIMKLAMVKLYKELNPNIARIVWSVHDELIVECDILHIDSVRAIMQTCMEKAAQELLPVMGNFVRVKVNDSERYNK